MRAIDFTQEFEGDNVTVELSPKQLNSLLIIMQNIQENPQYFIQDIETLDISEVNDYIEDTIGKLINHA
jgi:hypothetical protein